MTFEEFFKKKRIDLAALETGEPALFSEFKAHYEQMGEKSFDHTKKYWFNKIRRQFPLAPEVKTEKAHIANPMAEQTVTESLTETPATAPVAKIGFVPKFRAGNMPQPATAPEDKKREPVNQPAGENPSTESVAAPAPSPKIGFVPKFRAANMPKPALPIEEKEEEVTEKPVIETPTEEKPVENTAAKPAYKPRFNMKNMPPKPPEE